MHSPAKRCGEADPNMCRLSVPRDEQTRLHIHPSTLSTSLLRFPQHLPVSKCSPSVKNFPLATSTYDTTELRSMPAHSHHGFPDADPNLVSVACPRPHTPSLHSHGDRRTAIDLIPPSPSDATMSPPASDNTAAGMSLLQEASIYSTHDAPRQIDVLESEKEKLDAVIAEERFDTASVKQTEHDLLSPREDIQVPESAVSVNDSSVPGRTNARHRDPRTDCTMNTQLQTPSPTLSNTSLTSIVRSQPFFQTSW